MTRFGVLKRTLLAPPVPWWGAVMYVTAAIAIPTILRIAVDPLLQGRLPYVAYFPFVMLVSVFLGWKPGLITMLGSAVVANLLFSIAPMPLWSNAEILVGALLFVSSASLIVWTGQTLRRIVRELDEAGAREAFLARELGHRAKNYLTMIEALARQSQQAGRTSGQFFDALVPRIQTLARAQDLLTRTGWSQCDLDSLVREALEPFADHDGLTVNGPEVQVMGNACLPLVMALHELATNAAKYGSLSVPQGRLCVEWATGPDGACTFDWTETNGPVVIPPTRTGLGTRLLKRQPAFREVTMDFRPEGLHCAITLDAAMVVSRQQ